MVEIAIPELHEMRTAHILSIGSESLSSLTPDFEDGYVLTLVAFMVSRNYRDLNALYLRNFEFSSFVMFL